MAECEKEKKYIYGWYKSLCGPTVWQAGELGDCAVGCCMQLGRPGIAAVVARGRHDDNRRRGSGKMSYHPGYEDGCSEETENILLNNTLLFQSLSDPSYGRFYS